MCVYIYIKSNIALAVEYSGLSSRNQQEVLLKSKNAGPIGLKTAAKLFLQLKYKEVLHHISNTCTTPKSDCLKDLAETSPVQPGVRLLQERRG